MDGSFARYCAAVCGQVRFRPDRAAIQSELWDHLEDHAAALEAQGLSREAAKEAAVAAMGDPEEVGKALDALHAPVAGWLLRMFGWLSNLALAALCLMVFYFLTFGAYDLFHDFLFRMSTLTERQVAAHWYGELEDQFERLTEAPSDSDSPYAPDWFDVTVLHPAATAQTGDYSFSIPCAARFVMEDRDPTLYVLLKVVHPAPWLRHPELVSWISACDDLGNQYLALETALFESQQTHSLLPMEHITSTSSFSYASYISAFVTYYEVQIDSLDPDATRITLTYDRFGRQEFLLPISLEGGGPA